MEPLFDLIRENATWLFGGSSVAAIALAVLKWRTAVEKRAADGGDGASSGMSLGINALIGVLALIALVSGGISIGIGDVDVTVDAGDEDLSTNAEIRAGEGSTNVIVGGQGRARIGGD